MPVLGKVGLVNKGAYNSGTSYTALDFVKYNGSTYVALKGVQGIAPSNDGTNWAYLAQGVDVAVANSQTVQTPGTALDAVQANRNVSGTLAKDVFDELGSLNDALTSHFMVKSSGSMHDIHTSGVHYVTNAVTDKPHATGGVLTISFAANGNGAGIYQVASTSSPHTYAVNYTASSDTWTYNDDMTDLLVTRSVSTSLTLEANAANVSATVAYPVVSGYKLIAVTGHTIGGSGSTSAVIYASFISGANVAFRIRSYNTQNAITANIEFFLLYMRSSYTS